MFYQLWLIRCILYQIRLILILSTNLKKFKKQKTKLSMWKIKIWKQQTVKNQRKLVLWMKRSCKSGVYDVPRVNKLKKGIRGKLDDYIITDTRFKGHNRLHIRVNPAPSFWSTQANRLAPFIRQIIFVGLESKARKVKSG